MFLSKTDRWKPAWSKWMMRSLMVPGLCDPVFKDNSSSNKENQRPSLVVREIIHPEWWARGVSSTTQSRERISFISEIRSMNTKHVWCLPLPSPCLPANDTINLPSRSPSHSQPRKSISEGHSPCLNTLPADKRLLRTEPVCVCARVCVLQLWSQSYISIIQFNSNRAEFAPAESDHLEKKQSFYKAVFKQRSMRILISALEAVQPFIPPFSPWSVLNK